MGASLIQPFSGAAAPGTRASFQFWQQPVYQLADGTYVCPGFDGPTYASSAWDFVTISGLKTPGICTVDVQVRRDVDVKKPAGSNGATTTVHGRGPAAIGIEITIWTPEQLCQLKALWDQVFPSAGKYGTAPQAVLNNPLLAPTTLASPPQDVVNAWEVSHPELDHHNVHAMIIVGGSGPNPGRVANSRAFRIDAIEHLPTSQRIATSTPKSAQTAPAGSVLDPNAPASYPKGPSKTAGVMGP